MVFNINQDENHFQIARGSEGSIQTLNELVRLRGTKGIPLSINDEQIPSDRVDNALEQWALTYPDIEPNKRDSLSLIVRIRLLCQYFDEKFDQKMMEKLNLPLWGYDVLGALYRYGAPYELTPGQLSEAVLISPGAMTHRLHKLESWGYLIRKGSPDDGRIVLVS